MFKSELDRFEWLIDNLLLKTEHIRDIRLQDPNQIEVLLVATSLVERALSYSLAIRTLINNEQTTGTAPLQRAIYELWIEHIYLLTIGEPWINAIKAQINATLEVLKFAEARQESFSPDAIEGIRRNIASWSIDYPEIVEEIRTQRKKQGFHWSGLSRSKMERMVMPAPNLYQPLSWEAHAVLSPIRDVEFTRRGSVYTLRFEPQNTITVDPETVSYMVGGILYFMWDRHASFFGLPFIKLPADEEG